MRAILGIDAAWTCKQPSGVALVAEEATGWRLVEVAPCYQHFLARTDPSLTPEKRPLGSPANAFALLASAAKLCGRAIDLVAVDMPLAHSPIDRRRIADDCVSRAYGDYKCGTHSPNASRPGKVSEDLRESFEGAGYGLQTTKIATPGLIEVYPHPALIALADASKRLPYKTSKVRLYWPELSRSQRRETLLEQWSQIVAFLEGEISGVAQQFAKPASDARGFALKAYEDKLDAVICAWVGMCALGGRAEPFGNEDAAIWIPRR